MNAFLERERKKSGSSHGNISERRVAKHLEAEVHLASGALPGRKSDASTKDVRMEMKSTVKDRITIERHWLEKISYEAQSQNQTPALTISFVKPDGSPQMHTNADWVAIPLWRYKELLENENERTDSH